MKLLCIILSSLILSQDTMSQEKTGNSIPQNVIAAFNTKYPNAGSVNWKIREDDIEVSFKTNNKRHSAFYTRSGEWTKTEAKIRWAKNLPATVKKAFRTSEYAAWFIDEMKEVDIPGQHVYLIHVDDANVLKIADPYLFKDDYQLYFSESGELLKKEKLP